MPPLSIWTPGGLVIVPARRSTVILRQPGSALDDAGRSGGGRGADVWRDPVWAFRHRLAVAGVLDLPDEGRVDQPVAQQPRPTGDRRHLDQQPAGRHRRPGIPVECGELAFGEKSGQAFVRVQELLFGAERRLLGAHQRAAATDVDAGDAPEALEGAAGLAPHD